MRRTRSVALLVTLTIVGLTVALLASGAVANTFATADAGGTQSDSTNASVGTVMQASAADTANGVESGMFDAAYERADNESRAAVVSERTADLEAKVTALENERATLESRREELSTGAYRSQMARLTVQIASLERTIERTESRADEAGIGRDRLAELRGNATAIRQAASEQAGPDVAAVARGVAGGGPPADDAGPPADRGGPTGDESPGTGPDTGSPGSAPGETATGNGSDASNGSNAGTDPGERSSGNGADERSPGASPTDPGESNGESNDRSDTDSGTSSGADADD